MNRRRRGVSLLALASSWCGHTLSQVPTELPTRAVPDAVFVAGGPSSIGRLHQVLFAADELRATAATTWSAIELQAPTGGMQATTAILSVWISSQGLPAPNAMNAGAPAPNRGTDRQQVIAPRPVAIPAGVAGWIPFTFDRQFPFPGGSGLLVEIEWRPQRTLPLATFAATQVVGAGRWGSRVTRLGGSCSPTGTVTAAIGGTVFGELVIDFAYEDPALSPTAPGLFLLGMQPANASLAPLGAPGCVLGVWPAVALSAQPWGGLPVFTQRSTSPVLPSLLGSTAFAQGVFLHPALNPLGLLTTAAVELRVTDVPGPRRARHVVFDPASGAGGTDLIAVPILRLQ